jgi:hypothetical protein
LLLTRCLLTCLGKLAPPLTEEQIQGLSIEVIMLPS